MRLTYLLLLCFSLFGCADEAEPEPLCASGPCESATLKTEDLVFDAEAVGYGDDGAAVVTVRLLKPLVGSDFSFVTLSASESLTATVGSLEVELLPLNNTNKEYQATLSAEALNSANRELAVWFRRADGTKIQAAVGKMPDWAPVIASPQADAWVSRSEPLTIRALSPVANNEDLLSYYLQSVACESSAAGRLDPDGDGAQVATISPSSFGPSSKTCPYELTVLNCTESPIASSFNKKWFPEFSACRATKVSFEVRP